MTESTKAAVVTGASTGIGREVSMILATEGYKVTLVGRDEKALAETKAQIATKDGTSEVSVTDLRDPEAIDRLAKDVTTKWGAVEVIVNCAGVWHDGDRAYYGVPLWEMPREELDQVMEVGIRAPMLLVRSLLPAMIGRHRGKIVNISGALSEGGAGWLHYYVSKKALEHFTRGLADELRPHNIQVNCVSPANVKTPALKKFFSEDHDTALEVSDVARFVSFLASEAATHITGSCTVLRNDEGLAEGD